MKGFNVSQMGHVVNLFSGDATGGHNTGYFSIKGAAHVSLIIAFGAIAAAPTGITVNQAIDISGDNAVAMPFNLFACETANLDVLGSRIAVPSTGYVPPNTQNIFYVIEIDAAEMLMDQGTLPATDLDYGYLSVSIGAGAHATPVAITAILSGLRTAGETQPTALA